MKKYLLLILSLAIILVTGCGTGGSGKTPHTHTFTEGVCSCGEKDPNYKQPQNLDNNIEMHKVFYKYDELTKSEYGYIYIGYYPQSEITDEYHTKKLDKITEVNERGYIEYDGHEVMKVTVVNNHIYASPEQSGDNVFEYGTGYAPGTTHYFLVEPLAWKVLKYNEFTGEMVLQTENIIDTRRYYENEDTRFIDGRTVFANEYEHSEIRKWLNEEFFNLCFTSEEQQLVKEVINQNQAATKSQNIREEYVYNDTHDLVYLMSYQEATSAEFGFAPGKLCDPSRFATASDFANAKGLIKHKVLDDEGYLIVSSIWMTRTVFEFNTYAISYVGYDGSGATDFYVDAPNVGIRPCCTIVLK